MKRFLTFVIAMLLAVVSVGFAYAESIDVSTMTFDELVALEAQIESALLGSILEKNTELPLGTYVAGDDIAAGRYVITAESDYSSPCIYVKVLNTNNEQVESYEVSAGGSCKVTLKDGMSMVIDNNHSYEIHAKIRTMVGFLVNSSGYVLSVPSSRETDEAPAAARQRNEFTEANDNVYTYLFDKWNLYKAVPLSDEVMKIDCWYRFNAGEGNEFKEDHGVVVVNMNDGSSDFTWLDDEHSSFTITIQDDDNSSLRQPKKLGFTLSENRQPSDGQQVFTYLYDKWNLYKATQVSDNVVVIDCWYRFNAGEGNPFKLDHSVAAIRTDDGDSGFKWLDDSHTSFTVNIQDNDNLKSLTTVVFVIGDK